MSRKFRRRRRPKFCPSRAGADPTRAAANCSRAFKHGAPGLGADRAGAVGDRLLFMAPRRGYQLPGMPVLFLIVFIDLVGFGLVIPLLPFYAERLAASPLQMTLLFAVYSLMSMLAAPLWGRLSDRVGR